jgi:hypothetical protein
MDNFSDRDLERVREAIIEDFRSRGIYGASESFLNSIARRELRNGDKKRRKKCRYCQ